MVSINVGETRPRDDILRALVSIQYSRNDVAFERGTFRVRGDTVEIFPAYEEQAVRVELWGDQWSASPRSIRSPATRSRNSSARRSTPRSIS